MNVILGIDTGGTYTDGVLLNYNTKEVLRGAKTFTTKESLVIGIRNCIDKLKIETGENVCLVCLSTTLATNSVVEGKGARTGLITIGATKQYKYPVDLMVNIKGKMDIMGRETGNLYEEEVVAALEQMRGKIDTLAISGYASIRNPQHELFVKQKANDLLKVPVVCAHELTTSLGFEERTMTAALNARLIPVICQLIGDVRQVMAEYHISADIMIIKGDGHSMPADYAEAFPVETVFSGPAASLNGGRFISKKKDAVLADMGGTTTDVVCIDNGEAVLEKEGMCIGGRMTRIKSVRVHTFGLGGDSRLQISRDKRIVFGPKRAVPLCVATKQYPWLLQELKTYRMPSDYTILSIHDADCVQLLKPVKKYYDFLSERDMQILDALQGGAHTAMYLANLLDTDVDSLNLEKLEACDLIQMISVTPTDILHALGEYEEWNRAAAETGIQLLSERMGMDFSRFVRTAEEHFVQQVCMGIMESVFAEEGLYGNREEDRSIAFFFEKMMQDEKKVSSRMTCNFQLRLPLIGVGAPADAWIRRAAERLGAEFILPEHSKIANAIGAAVGDVKENLEAMISYDQFIGKYTVFMPGERVSWDTLAEAKENARAVLHEKAEMLAERLNLATYQIDMEENDSYINNICTNENTFIKSKLKVYITGEIIKVTDTDRDICRKSLS